MHVEEEAATEGRERRRWGTLQRIGCFFLVKQKTRRDRERSRARGGGGGGGGGGTREAAMGSVSERISRFFFLGLNLKRGRKNEARNGFVSDVIFLFLLFGVVSDRRMDRSLIPVAEN